MPPGNTSAPAATQATDDESATIVAVEVTDDPGEPWTDFTVKSGDNLSLIFQRAGYTDRDVYRIVHKTTQGKALKRIFPGQTLGFMPDDQGNLLSVRHTLSPLETVTYTSTGPTFERQRDLRSPLARDNWASGKIVSSLFLAGQKAGLSQSIIMELANIFGGVIDFVLDPRKGDTIHVLYEELYLDGEKYADGEILAASFTNRGTTFNAYRYQDSNGNVGYFNEEGVSMRKAFLMAPVDFTRVSSNFNLRRRHPIYKTTRPHLGTDYAAPRGTPVFATGDGKVVKAGYTRSNGNYVFIQHGEQYVTKYLHLNKRKVKRGQRVVQSQIIGSVGSTGAATGSHLHYEFLLNGVHRNPRTIHKKLPKAKTLAAADLPRFKLAIGSVATQLASRQNQSQVALAGSANLTAAP
ncbi:MAG: peptidoglycan DD-metalloendopeptidase family protein [Halieaceae bacterium]|nr:peptidoglycan DD-metalloendopeptidase family protein [Halieaceae bacterium]